MKQPLSLCNIFWRHVLANRSVTTINEKIIKLTYMYMHGSSVGEKSWTSSDKSERVKLNRMFLHVCLPKNYPKITHNCQSSFMIFPLTLICFKDSKQVMRLCWTNQSSQILPAGYHSWCTVADKSAQWGQILGNPIHSSCAVPLVFDMLSI